MKKYSTMAVISVCFILLIFVSSLGLAAQSSSDYFGAGKDVDSVNGLIFKLFGNQQDAWGINGGKNILNTDRSKRCEEIMPAGPCPGGDKYCLNTAKGSCQARCVGGSWMGFECAKGALCTGNGAGHKCDKPTYAL